MKEDRLDKQHRDLGMRSGNEVSAIPYGTPTWLHVNTPCYLGNEHVSHDCHMIVTLRM